MSYTDAEIRAAVIQDFADEWIDLIGVESFTKADCEALSLAVESRVMRSQDASCNPDYEHAARMMKLHFNR